jgi:hypothetical protein
MPPELDATRVPAPRRRPAAGLYGLALAAAAGLAIAVTILVGMTAETWVGRSFPGFFVLPNRVIPSVGLEAWPGNRLGAIYQRVVVAVDGKQVASNVDAYADVASQPPGTAVEYTLRGATGTETLTLTTRRFSLADYWIIFGSYLATGLLYLLVGMLAAWLLPESHLGRALLLLGGAGGIFALTGAGIYQPGAGLRIHALAEAFFPATLVYLAVVFAGLERRAIVTVAAIGWWVSLALAVIYQLVLSEPAAYTLLHNACQTYMGIAGLAVGATLIAERARVASDAGPFLRAAAAGAILGIGVPALIMMLSGVSGGALPVNFVTATAFLFPLCIGFGLLREQPSPATVPLASAS